MLDQLDDMLETLELAKEAAMQGRDMTIEGLRWSRDRWLCQWRNVTDWLDRLEGDLWNLRHLLDVRPVGRGETVEAMVNHDL